MGNNRIQLFDDKQDGFFSVCNFGSQWSLQDGDCHQPIGGLFASVNQLGSGFGISANPPPPDSRDNFNFKSMYSNLYEKYVSSTEGMNILGVSEEEGTLKKKKIGLKLKIKVKNPSLRRLISGGVAGAISRTAVAPLETIRTHLMVGSCGHSITEVFNDIMRKDGWTGLFTGNLVNVIRVAPSKAIELLVYDTVNKNLSAKPGEKAKLPVSASFVAGACAGVTSTLLTYPLELVKTRLTVKRGMYDGIIHAFVTILKENGASELYRGLVPSVIGVIPYSATNYFAYDSLRKAYKKVFKQDKIGNIETLLIGSAAGVISSTATFPLEVARKRMQVGAVDYKNVLDALSCILEQEGVMGLYKGLGSSCLKLMPAAGISFMCYEACKRILVEDDEDA